MVDKLVIERYDNKKYDHLYSEMISIIDNGDDVSDFRDTYKSASENIFIAFADGIFVGVAWFTVPEEGETVVGVWVKERYRNMGCASSLLKEIDKSILDISQSYNLTAYAFSDYGKKDSHLVEESGFSFSHSYVTMAYEGMTPRSKQIDAKINNYTDDFFEQMVDLRNAGIREVGEYYGEKSRDIFFKDDKDYRTYMKRIGNNAFTIVNDGILDAFVMVRGTEIMALNVRKEKRGRGYAEALVIKCIQHLRRMHKDIELICVDKNLPAYNLYEKIGFKPIGSVCCYKKEYK